MSTKGTLPKIEPIIPRAAPQENHVVSRDYELLYHLDSELRNPLTGIDSTSELLIDTLGNFIKNNAFGSCTCGMGKAAPFVKAVQQAVEDIEYVMYCAKYIRSILSNQIDLPRLKSGDISLQVSSVYLRKDIIDPIMKMLFSQKSDNVRVDIDCEEDLKVVTDSQRLAQLLESLLGVAFRSTESGSVTLRAHLQEEDMCVIKQEEVDPFATTAQRRALIIKVEATAENLEGDASAAAASARTKVGKDGIAGESPSLRASPPLSPVTGGSKFSWTELPGLLVKLMEGQVDFGTSENFRMDVGINLPMKFVPPRPSAGTANRKDDVAQVSPRQGAPAQDRPSIAGQDGPSAAVMFGLTQAEMEEAAAAEAEDVGPSEEYLAQAACARQLRALIVSEDRITLKSRARQLKPFVRGTTNTTLSDNISIALTGEECTDMCEKEQGRFDIVVVSDALPNGVMQGSEVITKLRNGLKLNTTVLIGCVNKFEPDKEKLAASKQALMAAGADIVWEEPLNMSAPEILASIAAVRIKRLGPFGAQLPGNKKFLLVDDSAVTVKSFVRRLKLAVPASWAIRTKPDLEKVMGKLLARSRYFDVIITGEYFGGGGDKVTGSVFMSRLRDNGYPGIIISCSADSRFIEKHLSCGADLAWPKPPPSNEIIVSQLLSQDLLYKLKNPEPMEMFAKQVTPKVGQMREDVVLAITAYNKAHDSKTKVKTNRKNAARTARLAAQQKEKEEKESSTADAATSVSAPDAATASTTAGSVPVEPTTGQSEDLLSTPRKLELSADPNHLSPMVPSTSAEEVSPREPEGLEPGRRGVQFNMDVTRRARYKAKSPPEEFLTMTDIEFDDDEDDEEDIAARLAKQPTKKEVFTVSRPGARRVAEKDEDDEDY